MVSARPMGHSRRRAARVLARQATNQRLLVGIVKFVAARMDSGPLSLHRSRTLAAASPPSVPTADGTLARSAWHPNVGVRRGHDGECWVHVGPCPRPC